MVFNPMWIPAIASGIGALGNLFGGGGQGQQIQQQPVDPALQQRYMKLLDYFLGRMGQGVTQLPQNMPISATPHPSIGGASDIYRSMAGMSPLSNPNQPWSYGQGTPFQYGAFLPTPPQSGRTLPGAVSRKPGNYDPYDPRSLRKRQIRQR